jgi:hypothetical protein
MANRFSVEAVFKAVDRITAPVTKMQNRINKMTRSIQRGLKNVKNTVDKVNRAMIGGAKNIAKFGALATAAIGTAAFIALERTADAADELAKRSRRLQFPIEELQEWQFVAEQSGLTSEQFDKSLEKFTKTVGEARAGTGTLITILKKANPELLEQVTNTENVADAFEIYLQAIRQTENQMDKTALATAAFGRSGAQLLNITEQSTDAIKALRVEQRENGIITKEQAVAAEAYNDAMNSLKRSMIGFIQQVLLPLMPMITQNIRAVRDWVAANREMIQSGIREWFIETRDKILNFANTASELKDRITAIGQAVLIVIGVLIALNLVIKLAAVATIAFQLASGLLTATLVTLNAATGAYALIVGALPKVLAAARIAMLALNLAFAANPVGFLVTAFAALVALAGGIMVAWDPVKKFFNDLGDKISNVVSNVSGAVGRFGRLFGFGDDEVSEAEQSSVSPQVVSPQERVARSIAEQRNTSTAEVTITDQTGRAEVASGKLPTGVTLQNSGAF